MGQYYYAMLREPATGKYVVGKPRHFCHGAKLMENGCIDSSFVKIVFSMIKDHAMNIAWVGDYAEEEDLNRFGIDPTKVKEFIRAANQAIHKDNQLLERHFPGEKVSGWFGGYLAVNHTKKEFLNQSNYLKVCPGKRRELWQMIDPLVALVAIGNGKGGGDFYGTNGDQVGRWATDAIELKELNDENEEALLHDGYKEIEFTFIEREAE